MKLLVLNAGSSSLKFQLFCGDNFSVKASGIVEQIGAEQSLVKLRYVDTTGQGRSFELNYHIGDHRSAVELMVSLFQEQEILVDVDVLHGIGHRVVHGGEAFHEPVLIDDEVITEIKTLVPLAPLHNPANVTGIEVAMEMFQGIPQVAVFDTAFHGSIPEHAYLYALPHTLYKKHQIRRYGFHGTSHAYVSKKAAEYLQQPYDELKIITLHLGNGASAAAIDRGQCVDTSMGLTPLEGLVMGTRSGDLDPAIIFYLARETGMDMDTIDFILNKKSGLKGICGQNDMRSIGKLIDAGDTQALLALEMFCYRIKKYVGAYLAVLGGADCLVFTGGIGENDARVREKCVQNLVSLGIILDPVQNKNRSEGITAIHTKRSLCKILVVPTDEEFEIATQTFQLIA